MKVINLKDLKVEEYKGESAYIVMSIDTPNLDLPLIDFDAALQTSIYGQLNKYTEYTFNIPVIFDFVLENFDGDEIDFKVIVDCILSILNQWFVNGKERREWEYRFGLPEQFSSVADTQLHLMKMINYETRFDSFSVQIKTEDLTYQFEYIGGEN